MWSTLFSTSTGRFPSEAAGGKVVLAPIATDPMAEEEERSSNASVSSNASPSSSSNVSDSDSSNEDTAPAPEPQPAEQQEQDMEADAKQTAVLSEAEKAALLKEEEAVLQQQRDKQTKSLEVLKERFVQDEDWAKKPASEKKLAFLMAQVRSWMMMKRLL